MSDIFYKASERFTNYCIREQRYRVAWLVGPAQHSKKTMLARQLADSYGWYYLNYTLTPGYFDVLTDTIASYQPEQLITDMRKWCDDCTASVLILDEIDAVLATWVRHQRRIWAGLAARLQYLPCGLIIVSHFFGYRELTEYLPDRDQRYCLDLAALAEESER